VHEVKVTGGIAAIALQIATQKAEAVEQVKREIEQFGGGSARDLGSAGGTPGHPAALSPGGGAARHRAGRDLDPEVRHVVAVASGKGGVGKSTVAANLAVALGQLGYRVGLLDSDIYGPSVPMMFGIKERPIIDGNKIIPFEKYGIKLMSLGFILETDTRSSGAARWSWRAIEQMLGDVVWGALDYLILDLPPAPATPSSP